MLTCPSSARNALPSSLMSSSTAVYLAPSSFSRFLALTQNGHLHSQCRTLSIWQRCATSLVHTAVTHTDGERFVVGALRSLPSPAENEHLQHDMTLLHALAVARRSGPTSLAKDDDVHAASALISAAAVHPPRCRSQDCRSVHASQPHHSRPLASQQAVSSPRRAEIG